MRKYIKMVTAAMIAVSLAACSENDDSVGDVTPDDSETPDVSTGAMAFAWFIWEKGFKGDPVVKWFN